VWPLFCLSLLAISLSCKFALNVVQFVLWSKLSDELRLRAILLNTNYSWTTFLLLIPIANDGRYKLRLTDCQSFKGKMKVEEHLRVVADTVNDITLDTRTKTE
jgi:hypothetical protein